VDFSFCRLAGGDKSGLKLVRERNQGRTSGRRPGGSDQARPAAEIPAAGEGLATQDSGGEAPGEPQMLARRVAGHPRLHCPHSDGFSLIALADELARAGFE
jgi:hypothetical protein